MEPNPNSGRAAGAPGLERWKKIALGAGLGLAMVIIAFTFYVGLNPQQPASAGQDSERALGPTNAPVIIVEYGDFGCSTCRAWEKQKVMPQIIAHYGDKIRFVWRDLPIITDQSPKAAEAAFCAFDQDKFWQYHDLLYQKAPALAINDLKQYAVQIGLDAGKFNACLDSGQHKAQVDATLQDGLKRGFRATPAFLINGKPLLGPPSYDDLAKIIDADLNN